MKKSKLITVFVAGIACIAVVSAIALCIVFPNKYSQSINAAADEFGLNRALVRSVVWAESKFDKEAVSAKGAAGLMQLMPDTYEHCAKALGVPRTENAEFDVENSLRCGCYYLSLMLEKYDGNVDHALMAYNAGENNADKFIAGAPIFGETQKYIKDVALAQKVYGFFA